MYFENLSIQGKEIILAGAGVGQTIIDGSGTGTVLDLLGPSPLLRIEHLTIQNGLGNIAPLLWGVAPGTRLGGAIQASNASASPPQIFVVELRNCEFKNNNASSGGAVYAQGSLVSLLAEDCIFDGNSTASVPVIGPASTAAVHTENSAFTARRCVFANNSSTLTPVAGYGPVLYGRNLLIQDCRIYNNTAVGVLESGGILRVERTAIFNNPGGGIVCSGSVAAWGSMHLFRGCLIYGNSGPMSAGGLVAGGDAVIEGCSIVDNTAMRSVKNGFFSNQATVGGVAVLGKQTSMTVVGVRNFILRGHQLLDVYLFQPPPGAPVNPFMPNNGTTVMNMDYSCTSPAALPLSGMGNITSSPSFRSPAEGDYRLKASSPCVDAGDMNSPDIDMVDIVGTTRVVLSNTDMGAYECNDLGLDPIFAGNVGAGLGGPFDVLKINGSAGLPERHVVVPLGSQSIVTMDQPPTNPQPAGYALFSALGEVTMGHDFALPFGIGPMSFVPCPAAPWLFPLTFVYAASIGLGPCSPIYPSLPAPWSSGPGPAIFFPLTLTFQGVIEETPGIYRVTNGRVWEGRGGASGLGI